VGEKKGGELVAGERLENLFKNGGRRARTDACPQGTRKRKNNLRLPPLMGNSALKTRMVIKDISGTKKINGEQEESSKSRWLSKELQT